MNRGFLLSALISCVTLQDLRQTSFRQHTLTGDAKNIISDLMHTKKVFYYGYGMKMYLF